MSAALKRPSTRTASACIASETARLTHSFRVVGSVLHRGFGADRFIRSATFSVGGHLWCIKYYPDGIGKDSKDYVAVFLELMSKNNEAVTVVFDLRLLNHATEQSPFVVTYQTTFLSGGNQCWGGTTFMKKDDLEPLGYLRNDCIEIECDLTVIMIDEVDVPQSDLVDNLGKMLESDVGLDVTFKVREVVFKAHKIVLAMRSPVFMEELYGPIKDNRKRSIVVADMEPSVFEALLHFIYTDSLPAMDDLDGNKYEEMAKNLLVAASRYGMERMKLMCESMLCKRLYIEGIATTLVLANQHQCKKLKDACIRFIGSSNRMDDVAASQGYENLKEACPALTVEMWEKFANSRKI